RHDPQAGERHPRRGIGRRGRGHPGRPPPARHAGRAVQRTRRGHADLALMSADLSHVDTWLFDLDNTLYPLESEFMGLIEVKMTDFVERMTGLPREDAKALQRKYFTEHGTTLAGLMQHHGMEPKAFLDEVHDVSMDRLVPSPELRDAIAR